MQSITPLNIHKNQQFEQQRTHYQQTINRLISENQMLKQQLQALAHFKHQSQDLQSLETKEEQNMASNLKRSQKSNNETQKQTTVISKPPMKYTSQELRQPDSPLNRTELHQCEYEQKMYHYKKQSYQLTNFLTHMKQKHNIQTSLNKSCQDDRNFQKLVQAMEDIIKMFEKDRTAFINKIQELLLLIAAYEKRQKEYLEKQRRFELDLSIANQQLVIFKRLKKTK